MKVSNFEDALKKIDTLNTIFEGSSSDFVCLSKKEHFTDFFVFYRLFNFEVEK
jgi:hypothetical protein